MAVRGARPVDGTCGTWLGPSPAIAALFWLQSPLLADWPDRPDLQMARPAAWTSAAGHAARTGWLRPAGSRGASMRTCWRSCLAFTGIAGLLLAATACSATYPSPGRPAAGVSALACRRSTRAERRRRAGRSTCSAPATSTSWITTSATTWSARWACGTGPGVFTPTRRPREKRRPRRLTWRRRPRW